MRSTISLAVLGLASSAQSLEVMNLAKYFGGGDQAAHLAGPGGPIDNGTHVVAYYKDLTTYCPEATVITHGGQTMTVTAATTLTITDCSCTITHVCFLFSESDE